MLRTWSSLSYWSRFWLRFIILVILQLRLHLTGIILFLIRAVIIVISIKELFLTVIIIQLVHQFVDLTVITGAGRRIPFSAWQSHASRISTDRGIMNRLTIIMTTDLD